MADLTPFLQIVHISDLHMSDRRSPDHVSIRESIRKVKKFGWLTKGLAAILEAGVAPHDPSASAAFGEFLHRVAGVDPVWSKCETWVVDTGDLTSLGDQYSLKLGQKFLRSLATEGKVASIYGNHDAWPGNLPMLVAHSAFAQQVTRLTRLSYNVGKASLALQLDIPNSTNRVLLFLIDSVDHDRINNTAALGRVGKEQLAEFKALASQNYDPQRKDFRILAVHHPVHYPPDRPLLSMSMIDDRSVAEALSAPNTDGPYPLAHLVLSGHTHFLFPKHGTLPDRTFQCIHPYLGDEQCQFVVGSLMQLDRRQDEKWTQQCEVLRLYVSDDPSTIVVERLLAGRQMGKQYTQTGIGPYNFVPLDDQTERIEEPILFNLF